MDQDTLNLILALQLEDAVDYRQESGKDQSEHCLNDADLAVSLYEENIRALVQVHEDRQVAQSLADAIERDNRINRVPSTPNPDAAEDNIQPLLTDDDPGNCSGDSSNCCCDRFSDELSDDFSIDDSDHHSEDENSKKDDSSLSLTQPPILNCHESVEICIICCEQKDATEAITIPCGHHYCQSCIGDLFSSSFVDETLFPPRCCQQEIPVSSVSTFLTAEAQMEFERKRIEFGTPNRTYCHNLECASFILPEHVTQDEAFCCECWSTTCILCKSATHSKGECPEDVALQAVKDLAREKGWQRCSTCGRMVELNHGCNHITCICGAQFCYVCGQQWKKCHCPQWDEDRLLARADQIVNRVRGQANGREREHQVGAAAGMLRDRHNCNHTDWEFVREDGDCEQCGQFLPEFLFVCTRCQIMRCRRCRYNRLGAPRPALRI